jgi:glycosyltransferase involved in cell wall biosynthesis
MAPLISFIIPVRDDPQALRRCLSSLQRAASSAPPVEIIVVDNGAGAECQHAATAAGAQVLAGAWGRVADLRNQGAAVARGEILAFVDADHEVDAGWIAAAIETLQQPGIVAAGAPYDAPRGGTWVQAQYDRLRRHSLDLREAEWLGSGNLAVRRDAFDAIGGFDARLETCEDVDFCQRLRTGGGRILCDPRMRSTHHGDPSTLAELFVGELWRGRDNVRVSFRSPRSPRNVASAVMSLVELALVAAVVAGLLLGARTGLTTAAAAAGGILVMTLIRSARMLQSHAAATPVDMAQTFVVAGVYGLSRALAIVARTPHTLRQRRV